MRKSLKFILISFFAISNIVYAGSCCSGASSSGQLILGTTKSVLRMNFSNTTVLADSDRETLPNYRSYNELESIRSLNLSYASYFSHLWQWTMSIPIISKSRYVENEWKSFEQVGDLALGLGYKFLPEYKRNILFNSAHFYTSYKFSNAPSIFTTKRKDLLNTAGSGHETLAVGLVGFKRSILGISTLQVELAHRFANNFSSNNIFQKSIQTTSSNDHSIAINHSKDLADYTFGMGINYSYIQNKSISVLIGDAQNSQVISTSFFVSKTFLDDYDLSINYSDDFLFGPSFNHILTRSLSSQLIMRIN